MTKTFLLKQYSQVECDGAVIKQLWDSAVSLKEIPAEDFTRLGDDNAFTILDCAVRIIEAKMHEIAIHVMAKQFGEDCLTRGRKKHD